MSEFFHDDGIIRGTLRGRGGWIAISLILLAFPGYVSADVDQTETDPVAESHGEESSDEPVGTIAQAHANVRGGLLDYVDRIDRFFGDENLDESTNDSYVRLGAGLQIKGSSDLSFEPRLRTHFSLPRTSKRLGVFLSGATDEDEENDLDSPDGDDRSLAAGLRIWFLRNKKYRVGIDAGSRFVPEPDPFARLRLQLRQQWGSFLIRPTQFMNWGLDDGWSEMTRLDINRPIGGWSLARFRTEIEYGEATHGVEFESSLAYFFVLDKRSAWEFRFLISAETEPKSVVTEYRPSFKYRRSVWKPWLFVEFEPRLRFERDHGYDPRFESVVRFEVVLGDLEKSRGAMRKMKPRQHD